MLIILCDKKCHTLPYPLKNNTYNYITILFINQFFINEKENL